MWRIAIIVLLCLAAWGCRCRSDLEPPEGQESGVVSEEVPVLRWCRACALRSFLSCKRVTGVGSEAEVRRKAELEACRDIGYSDEECTQDKIRFVECGIEKSE
jgi:hypothetical protein